jgi:hypothetical protein
MSGWIGVDLDGTLARYEHGQGIDTIGEPIAPMVKRVQEWIDKGIDVKVVTARVAAQGGSNSDGIVDDLEFATAQRTMIQDWCLEHIGTMLYVTATKDFMMIELWDDRAVRVVTNTGERCCPGAEL